MQVHASCQDCMTMQFVGNGTMLTCGWDLSHSIVAAGAVAAFCFSLPVVTEHALRSAVHPGVLNMHLELVTVVQQWLAELAWERLAQSSLPSAQS